MQYQGEFLYKTEAVLKKYKYKNVEVRPRYKSSFKHRGAFDSNIRRALRFEKF